MNFAWRGWQGIVLLPLVAFGLWGSGCSSGVSPASPLKALSGQSSDAALARAVQNDPFPSAAETGLATARK